MAILYPYMMLITLTDFWNYKLRNVTADGNISSTSLNHLQSVFPSYLSITANVPLALFVVLTMVWGYRLHLRTGRDFLVIFPQLCPLKEDLKLDQNNSIIFDLILLYLPLVHSFIHSLFSTFRDNSL